MQKDKGAHFRKCDFQVHSMRDARWSGPFDHVTQRAEFATALVASCRAKGINGIAITDHHDLALWKWVADAAAAELDATGGAVPEEEKLTVFPGVELTLSNPPCQALLLFDPTLSQEILVHIWGALGVTPTPDDNPKTTQTAPLSVAHTLLEITTRLDGIPTNPAETNPNKREFLKRRFILLPNVREGGHQTAIRAGFHTHFREMPCNGGYIEGRLYSDLTDTNRNKIEGKIEEWGKRRLAVFQTSDCRSAVAVAGGAVDFPDLGLWPTWVKWAQPSAEALRQACLAAGSRISHVEPSVPLLQVVGVKLSDSLFLGPIELALNPQFNALIGGRGTGKSSLLEYVRWALGDDPLPSSGEVELPNFQHRRRSLIDGTLKPSGASVTVYYKKNEVVYRIERKTTDREDLVTVSHLSSAPERIPLSQIRRDFPIVSYAQKQLSCVGTLPDEIRRLVTDPVKEALGDHDDYLEREVIPQLREQRLRELRLETLEAQIEETKRRATNKREQVQALQAQLKELSPEQQRVIAAHDILAEQQQTLERIDEQPRTIGTVLEDAKKQLDALGRIPLDPRLPALANVTSVEAEAFSFIERVITQLQDLIGEVQTEAWKSQTSQDAISQISAAYTEHKTLYDGYIQETAKNKQQFDEIQKLNKEIGEAETAAASAETERNTVKVQFDRVGNEYWDAFLETVKKRGALISAQCDAVSEQASNQFKAALHFCGDGAPLWQALDSLFQGRNIKDSDSKITALVELVTTDASPIEKWASVIAELLSLVSSKEAAEVPEVPLLQPIFTAANLDSIRSGCTKDTIERIRYLNIPDRISFSFKMGKKVDGEDNYIPFESASPGQQATCLLGTLLAQSGAPLLIDQPEEDLDNEQIQVLSEKLSQTKHNRQIIFVSHNANIVVNGDAELVACFGYAEHSGNAKGVISPIGSIDCKPVRDSITKVMEGGKLAFEMRRNKYGF